MAENAKQNFGGIKSHEYTVDENCIVHCLMNKNSREVVIRFNVELLGIEGEVGAFTGKHIDTFMISFKEAGSNFANFYTEEGQVIKKLVSCDGKYYMLDGNAYYEVTSDTEKPSPTSHEEFIQKNEEHKYPHSDFISENEKFEKILVNIFKELS